MSFSYSENVNDRSTIEGLAQSFLTELRLLIRHVEAIDAEGFTPSDFPLAKLGQQELNKLLIKVKKLDTNRD